MALDELLEGLDVDELLALRAAIDARLAELEGQGAGDLVGGGGGWGAEPLPPTSGDRQAQGWEETKIIHGRPYRYWRWWDGEHKRSKYIGPA